MEINNLDKLVKVVTENIINKMEYNTEFKVNTKSCLILIPNIGFGFNDYFKYIRKEYPKYDFYLGTHEEFSEMHYIENNKNVFFIKLDIKNTEFINLLNAVETIIVLGLKINQLKALSELDDKEDINHIILGSLMANKPLNIMINSNELIFNKISKMVNGIRNIGINVVNIQQSNGAILEKIDLITESYVMSLKENGLKNLILNKKQLITPLAKDRLSEYKIKVEYKKEEK